MSAARVAVRAWTLGVRNALAELGAARLRWCLLCARVGWWGWRPLCPSMPVTWVCADQFACMGRRAVVAVRVRRGWRRLV
jgi:hypothetical protein